MSNKVTKAIDNATLKIFMRMTRKKAKEERAKQVKRLNRRLTNEEKRLIDKRVAKKTRGRAIVIGALGLGILTGANGKKLLDSPNTKGIEKNGSEITIDLDETIGVNAVNVEGLREDEDKNLYVTDEKDEFKRKYAVDLDEINHNEDIQKSAQSEINQLNDSKEVLNYIKEMYVDEYNEKNNSNITINDVTLDKKGENSGLSLYMDKAENGDEIARICNGNYDGDKTALYSENGIVVATVNDENNIKTEQITYSNGKYLSVYDENEEVKEDNKESTLMKLSNAVCEGMNYYNTLLYLEDSSLEYLNDGTLWKLRENMMNDEYERTKENIDFVESKKGEFKNEFINSVISYKQSKIDEIKNISEDNGEKTTNNQIEEDNER